MGDRERGEENNEKDTEIKGEKRVRSVVKRKGIKEKLNKRKEI